MKTPHWILAFSLSLASTSGARAAAAEAGAKTTHEVFATADDGTPLHWTVYPPAAQGKRPVVLVIHGGGFIVARDAGNAHVAARELAAAGFVACEIEYRLAPPGKIEGQKSSGRFPDQTNDVHLAVRAARKDPRGNGQVGGVGGSAGGYHVAFAALTGTKGDDQLDVGVSLSGALDLSDTASQALSQGFKTKVINYAGGPEKEMLLAASPVSYVTKSAPPLFLIQSRNEAMPFQQVPDLAAKLLAAEVDSNQLQLTLPGRRHSWAYWPDVSAQAIAFIKAGFAPPAPAPERDRAERSTRKKKA
jgi:acetyl esterase/lipase